MNSNFTRDINAEQRETEAITRAQRLQRDFYTREAIRHYLDHCSLLYVDGRALLAPYAYLSNVPEDDFRWGTVRTV